MKNILYITVLILLLISCGSQQPNYSGSTDDAKTVQNDTIRIANDSLEYEIIIFEVGFNAWLVTQPPRGFYSQSTLELRNNFMVTQYNLRVQNPMKYDPDLYLFRIDYERNIDYGYEVNYLLYNYFLFFQQRYNQKLL